MTGTQLAYDKAQINRALETSIHIGLAFLLVAACLMTQRSKPALGGAQTAEPSNDLPRNDDSGTYITFDAPGAGTGVNQRTFPFGINPEGGIAGYSIDANGVGCE